MAGRSYWKGHLRLSLVSCAVALYPAVGAAHQLKCHTINRRTGNRINEEVVDAVTREPVPREDRVKGCEIAKDELVPIEEEELQQIRLESTHTLNIESFVVRTEVDERYLDKPYYLAPEDKVSREAFAVIRDAMREKNRAGLGRLVISRKERLALIEPFGKGMLATLLRAADEVRSPTATFEDIADFEAPDDMRELAAQLIERNSGAFDPSRFEDRYEKALLALVRSKARPAGKAGQGRGRPRCGPRGLQRRQPHGGAQALHPGREGGGRRGRAPRPQAGPQGAGQEGRQGRRPRPQEGGLSAGAGAARISMPKRSRGSSGSATRSSSWARPVPSSRSRR